MEKIYIFVNYIICVFLCTQFYKNLSLSLKDVVWKTEDDMQQVQADEKSD